MEISIALGGGGAKGNAHIGVLRVLEQEGCQIRAVAGTSFGGIVGALYAAGYTPDEIETRFGAADPRKFFGRKPGDRPSLMGLAGVERLLDELLGNRTFDDLALPFAVPAFDLESGAEVILRQGRVQDAVIASSSIPGVFPPQPHGNMLLADGGVVNPVPVTLARLLAPRLPVVAVVLAEPQITWGEAPPFDPQLPAPIFERIARLRVAQAFNIFLRSVDIGNRLLTEMRLEKEKPEVIIRPKVEHVAPLGDIDLSEVIGLGEQAARNALPALHRAISWQGKLSRWLRSPHLPQAEAQNDA